MFVRSLRTFGLLLTVIPLAISQNAFAQIFPDATLPTNSVVKPTGRTFDISGGTITATSEGNLFHSVREFSLPTGTTAVFNNPTTISNIITRVTGGKLSNIDGLIKANGNANLYLLNPSGIVFGPNAKLDLRGSFIASTADSLYFADGGIYSAVNPQGSPLLSLDVPLGLQFGPEAGPISVQGPGNQLFVDFPFIDDTFKPPGLDVKSGQTLALVGGDINLVGGNVTAIDGRIELGSVRSSDRVRFKQTQEGLTFNFDPVQNFGNVTLSQAASVDVSGDGVGIIQVHGNDISLAQGSTLLARTRGLADGGGLFVNATGKVELTGFSTDSFGPAFPTSFLTDVAVSGEGNGSPMHINTNQLIVTDGAFISSGTFDMGDAGPLLINAQSVRLDGGGPFGSSGLFTDTYAPGAGGPLSIKTNNLTIDKGARISSNTNVGSPLGSGPAGNLMIDAETINLHGGDKDFGGSGIFAVVETDRPGGNITLHTEQLFIEEGARIETTTFAEGNAGYITVNAKEIDVQGTSPNGLPSALFAGVDRGATGNGGSIMLNADQLRLTQGASISSETFGDGNAGNLTINVQDIQLIGTPIAETGFFTTVGVDSIGHGGNLNIDTNHLQILQGAQIATGTLGKGNSGNLKVNAHQIEISGGDQFGRSGLFASTLVDTGAGGDIHVFADQLILSDAATINVSNFQSQNAIPSGEGPAGSIEVLARRVEITDQSEITASTAVGDRGNISLQAQEILLDRGGSITTNASEKANGGNIALTSDLLVLRNGSFITANAVEGQGGNIQITTQGLFQSLDSQITASSELGVDGIVTINGIEADPSQAILSLPNQPLDVSNLVSNSCSAKHVARSSFVRTGRSGLPDAPTGWLGHHTIIADVRPTSETFAQTGPEPDAPPRTERASLVEAQGWVKNAQGQPLFVAQAPTVTAHSPQNNDLQCTPSLS